MIKKETKFGTPIITNMPEPLHNLITNFVEKLEDYILESSEGELTLKDIALKNPDQLEWISEVFTLNVTKDERGISRTY